MLANDLTCFAPGIYLPLAQETATSTTGSHFSQPPDKVSKYRMNIASNSRRATHRCRYWAVVCWIQNCSYWLKNWSLKGNDRGIHLYMLLKSLWSYCASSLNPLSFLQDCWSLGLTIGGKQAVYIIVRYTVYIYCPSELLQTNQFQNASFSFCKKCSIKSSPLSPRTTLICFSTRSCRLPKQQ